MVRPIFVLPFQTKIKIIVYRELQCKNCIYKLKNFATSIKQQIFVVVELAAFQF